MHCVCHFGSQLAFFLHVKCESVTKNQDVSVIYGATIGVRRSAVSQMVLATKALNMSTWTFESLVSLPKLVN